MTTLRPGKVNAFRNLVGLTAKEDYLLRPLINAIRDLPDYKHPSSTVQLHYDRNYIEPIKEQSELLEQEIKNNTNLQSDSQKLLIRNQIFNISNNKDLLIFFSKKERNIPYTSYKNKDNEIVEMNNNNSIYDKLKNIQTYYNNSSNKVKDDEEHRKKAEQEEKNRKENELRSRLQKYIRTNSDGRQLMADLKWIDIIVDMEYFINKESDDREIYNGEEGYSDREHKINDYVKILNEKCTNNEFKKIAREIIIRLCNENNLKYGEGQGRRKIPEIIIDNEEPNRQQNNYRNTNQNSNSNYRNTNTNSNNYRNTNTQNIRNTVNINKPAVNEIFDLEATETCPSGGLEPPDRVTSKKEYFKLALTFSQDKNLGCKNQREVTRKMQKLNNAYDTFKNQNGLAGGKKRKSSRKVKRRTSRRVKRRNTKRRYRK